MSKMGSFNFARGSKRVQTAPSTSEPELRTSSCGDGTTTTTTTCGQERRGATAKTEQEKACTITAILLSPTPEQRPPQSSQICTRAGDKKDFSEE